MSISSAYVRVMCDSCFEEEETELSFVYSGVMHTFGHYDHDRPRLPRGWIKIGERNHRCEDCVEEKGKGE